jgi:preprotein translocase subunit YajC
MWLFLIRPQRKEQKRREQMMHNLKKGDLILTSGGIVGKVVKFKEDRVEVKVDESHDTKVTFLRSAIVSVLTKEEKEAEGTKEKGSEKK